MADPAVAVHAVGVVIGGSLVSLRSGVIVGGCSRGDRSVVTWVVPEMGVAVVMRFDMAVRVLVPVIVAVLLRRLVPVFLAGRVPMPDRFCPGPGSTSRADLRRHGQAPMPRTRTPEATGAIRLNVSGDTTPRKPMMTAARTRMPRVCETVTLNPRATAWTAVPRVPTRYAPIRVLPWPGVIACPAPRAIAASNEPKSTIGERSRVWSRPAMSPPTPPGTAAEPVVTAGDAGTEAGETVVPGGADPVAAPGSVGYSAAAPGSGCVSGTLNGGRVGPPGLTENDTERRSSGELRRSWG